MIPSDALAQAGAAVSHPGPAPSPGLRVFFDCRKEDCDEDYIRREVGLIDYVRERTEADVHVLVTTQATGGGGTEYTIQFIGLRRFDGIAHTLTYVAPQASTQDERRAGIVEAFKRGLVRYLADTPLAERLVIEFSPIAVTPGSARDAWHLWVFTVNLGGTTSGEESNKLASLQFGGSANRTTDAWKVAVAASGNYSDNRFELSETESFRSITRSAKTSAQVVKSVSPRWSAAILADGGSSTFLNYDLRTRVAPGIEFNVFPYSESTRRILAVQYTVGFNTMDYREETIFDKTYEQLFDHQLNLSFTMRQPWGSGQAELSVAQFIDASDKYNVGAFGDISVRLFKGLSANTFISVYRTNDQIYLPREDATTEEILVRQQQLATSYRYTVTFGVTYAFGSIFNNVVNPRFGARSGGFEAF
jgi:hypothetical protein